MSTFLADMVKKGYSEDEVFGVLFESQRDRRRRRLQAIVIEEVAADNLKKMNELLTNHKLVIWRRENGFNRVAEGEKSCFHGHRSLPPTPQEYYASLWSEANALKDAISMPARTPWQKTIEFVDGLKGKLPDWKLAEIKRYVEKRCREEAEAQMTVTPVDTVQHCSPISQTPVPPSGVFLIWRITRMRWVRSWRNSNHHQLVRVWRRPYGSVPRPRGYWNNDEPPPTVS